MAILLVAAFWGVTHHAYMGIVHDARIYAADVNRSNYAQGNDLLSLSPQKGGSLLIPILRPVIHVLGTERAFYWLHMLFTTGIFIVLAALIRHLLRFSVLNSLIFAFLFSLIKWEVLTGIITLNEGFFSARVPATFLCLLGLFLALLGEKFTEKSRQSRWIALLSGLSLGVAFCIHPLTAVYVVPAILAIRPRTILWSIAGVILGGLPYLGRISMVSGVIVNSAVGVDPMVQAWIEQQFYLYVDRWPAFSQWKLLSQFLLAIPLTISLKARGFARFAKVQVLVSGVACGAYVLMNAYSVHVPFVFAIQPLRSIWIINVVLFFLVLNWYTQPPIDRSNRIFRNAVLVYFIITAGRMHPLFAASIAVLVVLPRWRWWVESAVRRYAEVIVSCLVLLFSSPQIYHWGIQLAPWVVIVASVPLIACIAYFRAVHVVVIVVVSLITFFHTVHSQRLSFRQTKVVTPAARQFVQHVRADQTVAVLAKRPTYWPEMSALRYLDGGRSVYCLLLDKGPVCFSYKYAVEFARRASYICSLAKDVPQHDDLVRSLMQERIDFVVTAQNIPLPLVDSRGKLKLYRVA